MSHVIRWTASLSAILILENTFFPALVASPKLKTIKRSYQMAFEPKRQIKKHGRRYFCLPRFNLGDINGDWMEWYVSQDFSCAFRQLIFADFIEISRQKKGIKTEHQAPVFRRLDNAIHWIKLYTVDNAIRSAITFPSHSNLFVG